jgi:hypothetical protein
MYTRREARILAHQFAKKIPELHGKEAMVVNEIMESYAVMILKDLSPHEAWEAALIRIAERAARG